MSRTIQFTVTSAKKKRLMNMRKQKDSEGQGHWRDWHCISTWQRIL